MPNIFANIVFFGWPIVVFWMLKRYPTHKAIFLATTLSILYLPNNFIFDLPLIPPLNRESLTALSLFIFLSMQGKKFPIFIPGLPTKIILGYLAAVFVSAELNSSPLIMGGVFLQGVTHYDALSNVIRTLLWLMPFFMGRYFLRDIKQVESIFRSLVVIAMIYTLFMLVELRLSPQMHNWVYGYGVDFNQQVRAGGYRAAVFVGHGLPLAFIISTATIAAFALKKNKINFLHISSFKVIIYMLIILFLSKTWSAMIYALYAIFVIFRLAPNKQIKLSFLLAGLILIYPVTKSMDIFPDKEIVSSISNYSPDRAQSLGFRFENEDILLEQALKQPFFGWSGWGRNRVYKYGRDISVTDGKWILEFGTSGIVGFVFYYLMLLMPIYYATKTIKLIEDRKDQVYFATLALVLSICIIDSINNTNMGAMHLLLAGALLGQAESFKRRQFIENKALDNKHGYQHAEQ